MPLPRQANREAAGRKHQRPLRTCLGAWQQAMAELDASREGVGQAARVEALADRARISGLALDDRRSERLEPLEAFVEPLDDLTLESRVTPRALGAEAFQRP